MALPALADDALHVIVFGPGVGEFIAVRAPPGRWLLIDGCGPPRQSYGQRLLEHYRASPTLIAFTHPHLDHTSGLLEVIDDATIGPETSWPGIGVLWPSPRAQYPLGDIAPHFGGTVEATLAAIQDRWDRAPGCKWELSLGTARSLGDATVVVCSPTVAEADAAYEAWRARAPWNPNRVATVLEVRWQGQCVLLGSDLEEKQGRGWTHAAALLQGPHAVTKVPHHGSRDAIHGAWLEPAPHRAPLLVATPYARENLPRFQNDQGMDRMLASAGVVRLTGLPRRHARQSAQAPYVARRAELEALGKSELDPVTLGWPDCFVATSIDASGGITATHGPGSVLVGP